LFPPLRDSFNVDAPVLLAAEAENRAIQRGLVYADIGFHHLEIRSESGKNQLEKLAILQNLRRDTVVAASDFGYEGFIGQMVNDRIRVRHIGTARPRDQEVKRTWNIPPPELSRDLEAYVRAHAVSEEDERDVQGGKQSPGYGLNEIRHTGERGLENPAFPPREL
jgi:hypothetical protein